ncbi:MAG: AMP-binding protein [Pseudomonadota bacterium]
MKNAISSTAAPSESREGRSASTVKPCPNWGPLTIRSLLDKWSNAGGDAVYLEDADGEQITFRAMHRHVASLSAFLSSQRLRPGDCILIRAGRRVEGLMALLAAWSAGINVCVVPESMSVRQATEGAVSFAPKMAIEAGRIDQSSWETPRILELSAHLFTIRMVGCFGSAPDGLVDLSSVTDTLTDQALKESKDTSGSATISFLHHRGDGGLERITRDQPQLLSQALASAVTASLTNDCEIGTAYDPLSAHGLLAVALPALLVGTRATFFDPVQRALDAHFQLWQSEKPDRRLVLPAGFSQKVGFDTNSKAPGIRVWVSNGPAPARLPAKDRLLVDCGGVALLPGRLDSEGNTVLQPGAIVVEPVKGDGISFGTLRLKAEPQDKRRTGTVRHGELQLSSPLAGTMQGRTEEAQPTGVAVRLAEDSKKRPVYVLVREDGPAVWIGNQRAHIAAINRTLGLTARWQDAAAFSLPDPVLGNRIEVAVEPRMKQGETASLPTLETVRTMLRESGISDAALPVRIHLVVQVPRRGRNAVNVEALDSMRLDDALEAMGEAIEANDSGELLPATQAAVA